MEKIQKELLKIIGDFDRLCSKHDIWYMLACGSVLGAVRHKGFIPWDSDMDVFVKNDDLQRIRGIMKDELPEHYNYIEWDNTKGYSLPFDRLGYHDVPHQEIYLDIFPIIGAPTNTFLRKVFTKTCYIVYKANHCKHADVRYSAPENVKKILFIKKFVRFIPDCVFEAIFKGLCRCCDFDTAKFYYTIGTGYGFKASMQKKLIMETERVAFENLMLPIPKYWDVYLTNMYGDYMTPVREGFKK